MTQDNLGKVLLNLGERENDAARLDEALQAVEGAWEVYKGAGINQYDESFQDANYEDQIRNRRSATASNFPRLFAI